MDIFNRMGLERSVSSFIIVLLNIRNSDVGEVGSLDGRAAHGWSGSWQVRSVGIRVSKVHEIKNAIDICWNDEISSVAVVHHETRVGNYKDDVNRDIKMEVEIPKICSQVLPVNLKVCNKNFHMNK